MKNLLKKKLSSDVTEIYYNQNKNKSTKDAVVLADENNKT